MSHFSHCGPKVNNEKPPPMTTAALARWLFDRQAATYDADPTLAELAWLDPGVRDFWTGEAAAILGWVGAAWGDTA